MYRNSGNKNSMTPYQAFTGKRPDLSVIRTFGARAYVHVPKAKRDGNLTDRAIPGTFVGYSPVNFYRVLVTHGSSRQVIVSKDVIFDETDVWKYAKE